MKLARNFLRVILPQYVRTVNTVYTEYRKLGFQRSLLPRNEICNEQLIQDEHVTCAFHFRNTPVHSVHRFCYSMYCTIRVHTVHASPRLRYRYTLYSVLRTVPRHDFGNFFHYGEVLQYQYLLLRAVRSISLVLYCSLYVMYILPRDRLGLLPDAGWCTEYC